MHLYEEKNSVHSFSHGVLKSGIDNADWIVRNTQHVLVLYDVLERALSKELTLWKCVFGVCENVYFVYIWTDLVDFLECVFGVCENVYFVYVWTDLVDFLECVFGVCENVYFVYVWTDLVDFLKCVFGVCENLVDFLKCVWCLWKCIFCLCLDWFGRFFKMCVWCLWMCVWFFFFFLCLDWFGRFFLEYTFTYEERFTVCIYLTIWLYWGDPVWLTGC